jgi:magnesium chelatase family protein
VLATARTYALLGVEARDVRVEVDVRTGLPSFSLVGLPDVAVREARERVRAAIVNAGFEFPQKRIIANLAPADLRKAGPGFDLALAAALLAATDQLPVDLLTDVALAGELALDGSVRPVAGAMAMAEAAGAADLRALVVADANGPEAAVVGRSGVVPIARLDQLKTLGSPDEPPAPSPVDANGAPAIGPDLADLRGQPALRRALEIAAAGGHSLLVTGPPGAGKSMAARRLPSILPPLTPVEAVAAARIASACGRPVAPAIAGRRPFRAPHHTVSTAGLIGGGNPPRPGEVTLAHHGVLFLDELPEFSRGSLEALRQPLEDGAVSVVRARYAIEFPSRFQLVAAANPCPCGRGPRSGNCTCGDAAVRAYEAKLTGALADRIDISLAVAQPDLAAFTTPGEGSRAVRERVIAARERQAGRGGPPNAARSAEEIELGADARSMLADSRLSATLGGRGRERVIRVSRTIADLAGRAEVDADDVVEAMTLRRRAGP